MNSKKQPPNVSNQPISFLRQPLFGIHVQRKGGEGKFLKKLWEYYKIISFINWVDNVNWPSDEGLMLKMSASEYLGMYKM